MSLMKQASQDLKVVDCLDYASGTSDRDGATIDTYGYDGVMFIVKLATVAASAVTSILVEQGDASNLSDAATAVGSTTSVADDDDNQIFVIDVFRPVSRYLRVVMDKDGSNACAESAVAVLYGAESKPVAAGSQADVTVTALVSPADA